MKVFSVLFFSVIAAYSLIVPWQPTNGNVQIPIWPGVAPGEQAAASLEKSDIEKVDLVAGKPWISVSNVPTPTMTVYSPKKKNTGVAVIVFPGGGHKVLAIDLEGTEVCDWLTSQGITCVLLKYRVPFSGCYYDKKLRKHVTPEIPKALQDAQRTISTIRFHAKKYKIDPNKIGVMGFSAGGNLAVLSSTRFKTRAYEPIDEIDRISCRPDFAIPAYPGHMTMEHKNKAPREVAANELNTDIVVSTEIPPTLLIHAENDPVDPVHYSEVYARELNKVGVEVTFVPYKTGGHAFGVRKTGKDTDRWTDDAITWLKRLRFL